MQKVQHFWLDGTRSHKNHANSYLKMAFHAFYSFLQPHSRKIEIITLKSINLLLFFGQNFCKSSVVIKLINIKPNLNVHITLLARHSYQSNGEKLVSRWPALGAQLAG